MFRRREREERLSPKKADFWLCARRLLARREASGDSGVEAATTASATATSAGIFDAARAPKLRAIIEHAICWHMGAPPPAPAAATAALDVPSSVSSRFSKRARDAQSSSSSQSLRESARRIAVCTTGPLSSENSTIAHVG